MTVKYCKTRSDDLSYWNVKRSVNSNEVENVDNEERSIALSVSLLLKNKSISRSSRVRLPSHLISSPNCQCHRSFHLFCTDLLDGNDKDIDMINIHPAPRNREKDARRSILVSTLDRKHHHHRHQDENDQDTIVTTRSEPNHTTTSENQLFERKLRVPPKLQTRTTSLNVPPVSNLTFSKYNNHRSPHSFQIPINYSPSIRASKQATSFAQLQIRALSVFDQSPSTSQMHFPRGPPPSPKTPTQEASTILPYSITPAPFRAISIIPRPKNTNDNDKKVTNTPSVKNASYQDHAREYLSASDCSDNESDDNDKNIDKMLTISKPKLPLRTESLLRPGTSLRDRYFSYATNRYLSLAEVYYSPLDMYKNISYQSRRRLRAQTRLMIPTNENDDALTNITKSTTKTTPIPIPSPPQSKSVFGFSKTASSMHFGHAAGRLGLQGSFEKWPQPLSRRTPMERKQEVTTLRLVTLPLVTS